MSRAVKLTAVDRIEAGMPTENGRMYPLEVLERAVAEAQNKVNRGGLLVYDKRKQRPWEPVGYVSRLDFDGQHIRYEMSSFTKDDDNALVKLLPSGHGRVSMGTTGVEQVMDFEIEYFFREPGEEKGGSCRTRK